MNLKQYIYLLAWTFLIVRCSSQQSKNFEIRDTPKNILIQQLTLDSISLDLPSVSYQGFFQMPKDTLYYFDKIFATVSLFTPEGKYIDTHLGMGESPQEIEGFSEHIWLAKQHFFIIPGDFLYYIYNTNWHKVHRQAVNTDAYWRFENKSLNTILKEKDKPTIYVPNIIAPKFLYLGDNQILMSVGSYYENFNPLTTPQPYFENMKNFGIFDIQTNKIIKVFGAKSPMYSKYTAPGAHDASYIDYQQGQLYSNSEPDSLIYVYDSNFEPQYAFGRKAQFPMNLNYQAMEDWNDKKIFDRARVQEGYYADIRYFPEEDLLFRAYTTGANIPEEEVIDGFQAYLQNPRYLQIYHKNTLIADLAVPKRFKILGKHKGYFYADGILDEQGERAGIYRFKIDTKKLKTQ